VLFLASSPPLWVLGAGAGAGAAVPAVAVNAGVSLTGPSWRNRRSAARWLLYLAAGLAAAATVGEWLVLVLLGCGAVELAFRWDRSVRSAPDDAAGKLRSVISAPALLAAKAPVVLAAGAVVTAGTLASVAWEAFKVGALAFGGGFVIIPLMQTDAVSHYHWMTGGQFLNAVALGQITPGPVVQTVAVIGYAAAGIGAGPAAIGAILGSAITLGRTLSHPWQYAVLAGALVLLIPLRRGVVLTLLSAAAVGVLIALAAGI
jgi:chromate transporter